MGACGARGGDLKWIQIFGMGRDLLEYLVVCGAVGGHIAADFKEF